MKSAIAALTIMVCLSSCAPARFSGLSCPPVRVYSKSAQQEAADELQACATYAPAGFCHEVFSMLGDYHVLRAQAQACKQVYGPPKP